MKKLSYVFYFVLAAFLASCGKETISNDKYCGQYVLKMGKSEWNYGTIYDIDSLTMHSENHVTIWTKGKKQDFYSKYLVIGKYGNCR